jgi:hypothetical protein
MAANYNIPEVSETRMNVFLDVRIELDNMNGDRCCKAENQLHFPLFFIIMTEVS